MIKLFIRNKIFHYIFSRYFIYALQFINTVFLAIFLGPFFLGIWGFIQLIIQYFNQINFGIPHALNNILSIHKKSNKFVTFSFNTGLSLVFLLCVLVVLLFVIYGLLGYDFGESYKFNKYSNLVCAIIIFNYLNSVFINLFRVYNKLWEITFSQAIFPILTLFCLFFYRGEDLLNKLVWANLLSFLIVFLLFIVRSPIKIYPIIAKPLIQELKKKSLLLFLYNSSFYLIIISTRSLISSNYSVTQFGLFTFAFSLASIVLLLLDSFSFLIFPKMINRLAKLNNEDAFKLLHSMRSNYILLASGITHFAIFCFPFFVFFFPKYQETISTFSLVAITQLLYATCFGFPVLLMARKKEKQLAFFSFTGLILNVVLGLFLIHILNVDYTLVIFATSLTYMVYTFFIVKKGLCELNLKTNIKQLFLMLFPLKLSLPIVISIFLSFSFFSIFQFIFPLFLFILMNFSEFKKLLVDLKKMISNPDLINI